MTHVHACNNAILVRRSRKQAAYCIRNSSHARMLVQVHEMEVDAGCPQKQEFEIVRCTGHQHIGARCITLFNADTDEQICQSCPVMGTKEGAHLPPNHGAGFAVWQVCSNTGGLPCEVGKSAACGRA